MKLQVFSCRITGAAKLANGRPCQDALRVVHTREGAILAVADGHGDRRCLFSGVGASLAVQAGCQAVKPLLRQAAKEKNPSEYLNRMREKVAMDTVICFGQSVLADFAKRCPDRMSERERLELTDYCMKQYSKSNDGVSSPSEIREQYVRRVRCSDRLSEILYLYGTTLRVTAVTEQGLFSFGIGDGENVAFQGERHRFLLPPSRDYEMQTASLCEKSEDVIDDFFFSFFPRERAALTKGKKGFLALPCVTADDGILLATDGFGNSFLCPEDHREARVRLCELARTAPRKTFMRRLKKYLQDLSQNSYFQDDMALILALPIL